MRKKKKKITHFWTIDNLLGHHIAMSMNTQTGIHILYGIASHGIYLSDCILCVQMMGEKNKKKIERQ